MILVINTAEKGKIIIGLKEKGRIFWQEQKIQYHESEKLLAGVDKFLKSKKGQLNDLKGIMVVIGPGGFTSLRVGVIIANTLAFALKIPVAGFKQTEFKNKKDLVKKGIKKLKNSKGRMVLPFYGKEPHITKPKN